MSCIGHEDHTFTVRCPARVVAEIRVQRPDGTWAGWHQACEFHAATVLATVNNSGIPCECGRCPVAAECRPFIPALN